MRTSDLDYDLPDGLIAQQPVRPRDHSRLLVLHKGSGADTSAGRSANTMPKIEHRRFYQIAKYLQPGDLIVFNNTKVVPCRLIMQRLTGGRVEMILVKSLAGDGNNHSWEVMLNSNCRLKEGEVLANPDEKDFTARLTKQPADRPCVAKGYAGGAWYAQFSAPITDRLLSRFGIAPLPPYIKRRNITESLKRRDIRDYQTVYACKTGAIAAPTAGLHFTKPLLSQLIRKGVRIAYVTLQVGPGTFKPIKSASLAGHKMEAESFEVLPDAVRQIMEAKRDNRRIIAVGTTATRVLETISGYISSMLVHPWLQQHTIPRASVVSGDTDLFIRPPYKFKLVTALITNFHQPRSTPLALACAFAGRERIFNAYQQAISREYRFYSYGDAMLVI
jgi:S-adenosylmethionine:tRNA ribosyltransferase-isomerase